MIRIRTALICTLLAASCLLPARAEDKRPLDAILIMDSSGSMKTTDPQELRKPAAKLFITLLGNTDRLGVMSFSDQAWPITYLTALDSKTSKDKSRQAADKISSKGMYTNIHAALARGIELLKDSDSQGREPVMVLMSDGKLDVGNAAQSAELRKKITDELIPQIKQYKIKVYSIAFTEQSDQELLQFIAEASDGRYALAASDDALHKAFTKIFEQSKEPNLLPLTENRFLVDASIREITILANKEKPDSKIFLETPSLKRHNARSASANMQWFEASDFEMITISQPEAGEWKILFSDNDNKAYIVADIELRSRFSISHENNSQTLNINTWFNKNGQPVREAELLANMSVKLDIELPDGKTESLSFPAADADGQFIVQFAPTQSGIYAATVTATSKTFQRQQVFSFRSSLPETPAMSETAAPAPETLKETDKPAEETSHDTPEHPADAAHEETDILQTVLIFAGVNIVLLLIGVNVFFFLRSRKNKTGTD